ncbi:hypothetical protein F985_03875 [Acinetobacter seifertii]|uniref:Apea-like HEPN domain-containing protein n=1 Tax=Acinetobacter seifertii TaxID=1530123 RepID=N8QW72_9GAMM|nr:hypothetical protein [Acinetobacter seifertii]ENU42976.1 hypothetical protein F985_03875 [Acinetobacter seifertii]
MIDIFTNMKYIEPLTYFQQLKDNGPHNNQEVWEFTNEIKPIDLYCYLNVKFGPPNGLLTFLRNDTSNNLIHWDWALISDLGNINIEGHNFRTEVHVTKDLIEKGITVDDFINQIKSDFKNYGREMSEFKKQLEKWTEFINPFARLQETIRILFGKLEELNIDPENDKIASPFKYSEDIEEVKRVWNDRSEKYMFATGLIYGLRSMLPVMAESFINLLIFTLCQPEIKKNERLFNSFLRNPIDIRIQSLHLHCEGFTECVDYDSPECKDFHTLINERNDLLHGNININKLAFGEVYFNKRTPIFTSYKDFWEKSIGISLDSVKYEKIYDDMLIVENFIGYVLSKLKKDKRNTIEALMINIRLGYDAKRGKTGILFPKHLAEIRGKK